MKEIRRLKRMLCFLLCGCLLLPAAGCGKQEGTAEETEISSALSEAVVDESSAMDQAEEDDALVDGNSEESEEVSEEIVEEIPEIIYVITVSEPFLSVDRNGLINPEGTLSVLELKTILSMVVPNPEDLEAALAALGETSDNVIVLETVFQTVLEAFVPEEDLTWSSVDETAKLQRGTVAQVVYDLSDLKDKIIVFDDLPVIGRDIDIESELGEALLIASVPFHAEEAVDGVTTVSGSNAEESSADESSEAAEESSVAQESKIVKYDAVWEDDLSNPSDAILNCLWEPGTHLLAGYLYRVDEDGQVLRNAKWGDHLTFGENGRYYSGCEELDDLTSELIRSLVANEPDATMYKLLYRAYQYVTWNTLYTKEMDYPDYGENCDYSWYIPYALRCLRDHKGVCYGFSAGFCALARNLGYDAHSTVGKIFPGAGPHSWVRIDMPTDDGRELTGENIKFFDPELYWRGAGQGLADLKGFDMFNVPVRYESWWIYVCREPSRTCKDWTNESVPESDYYGVRKEEPAVEESSAATTTQTPEELVAWVKTILKEPVSLVTDVVGEPISKTYTSSCMGDGDDGVWEYDGWELLTYKEGDTEIILYAQIPK